MALVLLALLVHWQFADAATFKQIPAELKSIHETCKGEELCGPSPKPNPSLVTTAKCGCDIDCAMYGDCCRDSVFFNPSDTSSTLFACISQPRGYSYYMVAKCPANADPVERRLCENPRPTSDPVANNLPVTVPFPNGLKKTYFNAHCAKCNGIQLTSAEIWTPFIQCYDSVVEEIPTDKDTRLKWNATTEQWAVVVKGKPVYHQCEIDFKDPDKYVNDLRKCRNGGFVDKCLPRWRGTHEERMCRSYTAFVMVNNISYRNVYCVRCNNEDETKSDCSNIDVLHRGVGRFAIFSTLLKVSEADREECKINEIYDKIFDTCRSIVCPPGRENCSVDNSVPKKSNVSRISVCSRIGLEKGTFEISQLDNRTVWVEKYGRNFTEGNFLVNDEGGLEICTEDIPEKFDRFSFVMGIVTIVGLGLSIFFLVLHLCAVALVPELRNHSGMNLASLCVALIGAYSAFIAGAFLSGERSRRSCGTIAVFTYFFFLSAFFWMLIIAFDVWRVLRGAVRHFRTSSGRQYCRFLAYSLFSWGIPAVLTVTAVLVDMAPPGRVDDRFRPRFGLESCWFSRRLSLVAFFATPLAVVMALNVVFFVSSAFMASSTSRLSPASTNVSGQKRDFRLYLRLAVLLGLTWIVGLLAAVMDYEPLWICFVLFNTLQGLFIFAVFTCTSKVLKSLTKPHPWTERLRASFKRPPSKPTKPGSDVGLSQSTSETTLKSSGIHTSVELSSHSSPPSRKSSANLEVTGLPQRLS